MRRPPTVRHVLALALALALGAAACSSSPPEPPACTSAAQCDDGNACTADACTAGRCAHAPEPQDTLCSAGGGQVCDGAGACVACNRDAQCAGTSPSTDCAHPVCSAGHHCEPFFLDAGTVTSTQVAGDCHRSECDGAGATRSVVDDTDVPDDLSECTTDTCTGGVPAHAPVAVGTPCGGGASQCTASGHCGCQGDGDCTAPATCGGGGTAGVCGCTPLTCGGAGYTCGAPSNGCGGALSCDDTAKDGGETDVDCGGSALTCATRCALGKSCQVGSDCASGFCADGVCCDTACAGTCQACSAAKRGTGSDGVCGAIVAGTDPDAECPETGAAGCGTTGACNGAGACQLWSAATVCAGASCTGSTFTSASTCDGLGTCLSPGTLSCAPYVCGASACKTSCVSDVDCVAGYVCSAAVCVATASKTLGSACVSGGECQSGFCADGLCCNTACAGGCQACSAARTGSADGTCANVLNGTDPRGACPDQGICQPGSCQAGVCYVAPSSVICQAAGCVGNVLLLDSFCTGVSGVCPQNQVDCTVSGTICAGGACVAP